MRVWFDHAASGLTVKGGELKGFEVAGANVDLCLLRQESMGMQLSYSVPMFPFRFMFDTASHPIRDVICTTTMACLHHHFTSVP
jgi:hypothetical protein